MLPVRAFIFGWSNSDQHAILSTVQSLKNGSKISVDIKHVPIVTLQIMHLICACFAIHQWKYGTFNSLYYDDNDNDDEDNSVQNCYNTNFCLSAIPKLLHVCLSIEQDITLSASSEYK